MLLSLLLAGTLAAPWGPMTEAERKEKVARLSKEELEDALRNTPPELLLDLSAQAVVALGAYQYIMVKQERIRGTLQGEQTIRTSIQEEPSAIRLEYLKGLDEHGRAARGLVVNDALHRAPVLRFHGHHVPAGTLGDDRVLQVAREIRSKEPVEAPLEPGLRRSQLGARRRQRRARAIEHLARAADGVLDPVPDRRRRVGEPRPRGEGRVLVDVAEQRLGRADGGRDREQLVRIEDAAEISAAKRVPNVLRAAQTRGGLCADERLRRRGLVLKPLRAAEVRLRRERERALVAGAE